MIYEKHRILVERMVCVCDRCGKQIAEQEDRGEWQERFAIRFRGGYGSIFGDGNTVAGDFCQACIKQVLGAYLRIVPDPPSAPGQGTDNGPERIFQPDQLDIREKYEAWSGTVRTDPDRPLEQT